MKNNIIDVIILSYTKNDEIIKMNNNCINSIINSTDAYKFNIYLIETETGKKFEYSQKEVIVIQPGIKFNYNKFLNIGLKYCKNEWILITNNDTIYENKFIDFMVEAHKEDSEILSMSPLTNNWPLQEKFNKNTPVHYGHRLKFELVGWCIFLNRRVINIIGDFDENYNFWYQDDDYAQNLIKYKIRHALITNARVTHLLSKSNYLLENFNKMTSDSFKYFKEKWDNSVIVDFIIPTYDRIHPLKSMLASLICQNDENWTATVVIDSPIKSQIEDIIESFHDVRITKINLEKRYNDWGHTPREVGKQKSNAKYVIMTGDDNYYTPNFVKELKNAIKTNPGIVYWDMVHSHTNYSYFKCSPSINHIDMGAFATRADLAKQIKLKTTFAADGDFIEEFKKRFPREKMIKIEQVLFIHN